MSNETEKEWNAGCLKTLVVFIVATLIIFFFVIGFKQDRNNRSGCEQIDGEYEVVGQEYIGKVTVDVYGCVK